jgi:hypothetical protein
MRHAAVEHMKVLSRELIEFATPKSVREVLQAKGDKISMKEVAEIVKFAQSGDYRLEVNHPSNLHLSGALKMALDAVLYFKARTWLLMRFSDPVLITSDEPVALVGRNPHAPGDAPGLMRAAQIVFPMDPRHALIMLRPDIAELESRVQGGPDQARIINSHVAFSAHRFLVRLPGTNPLDGMTFPKKAPSVFTEGDLVGLQFNASEKRRAETVEKVRRGKRASTRRRRQ